MIGDGTDAHILRGARWLLSLLWEKVLIGSLLFGAAIGLVSLASRPSGPGADTNQALPPGSGITVRTEVADIWLPKELYELALRRSEDPGRLSYVDSNLFINMEGGEKLWYAIKVRHVQANGRVGEITTIEYPGQSLASSDRLLEILDNFDAGQPDMAGSSDSSPDIHIIPEELLDRDPRAAVLELLRIPRSR